MKPMELNVKYSLQCELFMVKRTQALRASGFVLDLLYHLYCGRYTQHEIYPLSKSFFLNVIYC